ncbi:MAG: hypothetical protein LUH51_03855, partial [Firmicutes bacterium]|nr:hypothetical protein [Bacillota bacterium]
MSVLGWKTPIQKRQELEAQGWIASVPGKGSFVTGARSAAQAELENLHQEFDKLVRQLRTYGVSREELRTWIEGGEDHA